MILLLHSEARETEIADESEVVGSRNTSHNATTQTLPPLPFPQWSAERIATADSDEPEVVGSRYMSYMTKALPPLPFPWSAEKTVIDSATYLNLSTIF